MVRKDGLEKFNDFKEFRDRDVKLRWRDIVCTLYVAVNACPVVHTFSLPGEVSPLVGADDR